MIKFFFWMVLLAVTPPLWMYYKLGLGGDRRDEIQELLAEVKNKLRRGNA